MGIKNSTCIWSATVFLPASQTSLCWSFPSSWVIIRNIQARCKARPGFPALQPLYWNLCYFCSSNTKILFSTKMRQFIACFKWGKDLHILKKLNNFSKTFIVFSWRAGSHFFTGIQNLSRGRSVNLIVSMQSDCSSWSPSLPSKSHSQAK